MTGHDSLRAVRFRAFRTVLALRRPSARRNARGLRARRESLDALLLREAVPADIPKLAALHVAAWNDAYAPLMTGPPVAVRELQWRQAFAAPQDWFCYVLVRDAGELVGFAKGIVHAEAGDLNKLFLARSYQRLGLGRRLLGRAVQRFRSAGLSAMKAYVDPRNPSCGFFERLGGRWDVAPDGRVNFSWYLWDNLPLLERYCTSRLPNPRTPLAEA